MATKNNPKNKGVSGATRVYNGKEIEPIKYVGTYAGHGVYMAAKYAKTSDIIIGTDEKPVAWTSIPLSKS